MLLPLQTASKIPVALNKKVYFMHMLHVYHWFSDLGFGFSYICSCSGTQVEVSTSADVDSLSVKGENRPVLQVLPSGSVIKNLPAMGEPQKIHV